MPKKYEEENRNLHVGMLLSTKFQSIWKTSNFGTNFAQKNMTDKNFEKINMKIVISIEQCIPIHNFS